MDDLRSLVVDLAEARNKYEQHKGVMDELEAEFKLQHMARLTALESAKRLRDDIEGEIRQRTYSASDKAPAPGLTVKMVTMVSYTPSTALGWAVENHHHNLLMLNARAFEQVAKALRLDFVIIEQVPTVTIARDLTPAAAQIGTEMAAEATLNSRSQALRAAGYGPCTEALCGKQQDVAGFFEGAAKAVADAEVDGVEQAALEGRDERG